jgi:alpha-tubulin suppressor-like RCC1 family protein
MADALTPVRVGTASFRAVAAGDGHTCAVRVDGTLWCGGRNSQRQLGPASSADQVRALIQVGSAVDWADALAGLEHSCGLRTDRSLWCWGTNTALSMDEGFPLGVPGNEVPSPTRVPGGEWRTAATDTFHTCAIAFTDGALWCWGRNAEGQLGSEDVSLRTEPTLLERRAISVDTGLFTTCIVDTAGVVACTGENGRGQLGSGDSERPYAFTDVLLEGGQ